MRPCLHNHSNNNNNNTFHKYMMLENYYKLYKCSLVSEYSVFRYYGIYGCCSDPTSNKSKKIFLSTTNESEYQMGIKL